MENKRSAAYNTFLENAAIRSEDVLYVNLTLSYINDTLCLYGTAATMYQFGDGAVNLHYYVLLNEKDWKHSSAPGQVILEKEGVARLVELLAK